MQKDELRMLRSYRSPDLVELGELSEITLGSGGNLPDVVSGIVVNDDCQNQTFTGMWYGTQSTFTRTACLSS